MGRTPREGWEAWRPGATRPLPGLARVIGHRGAALHAPENTLGGIRRAHELGCAWVEFDVKLTRDGVPILMHDETIDRTTGGRGVVAGLDHARLRELDAGARFATGFAGERIPTLVETLELALELGLGANVEIKPCPGREVETARIVAQTLCEVWPLDGPPLLVSSFSVPSLMAVRATAPGLALGLLVERVPRNWAAMMIELGCTTLHPWYLPIRGATVRELALQGVPVLLYTVNDPGRAARLFEAGARSIITDAPDRILPVA